VKLYRAMARTGDGPSCGDNDLGVRVPEDVEPDENGDVHPRGGGMSVTPDDPTDLPRHRRPRALGGTSKKPVWVMESAALPATLDYLRNTTTHGLVEPAATMRIVAFRGALASTRDSWAVVYA
jgi:hypothetical protein